MQFSPITAGALLVSAACLGRGTSAPAQDTIAAPTYSRLRIGADDWQARGGFRYGHGGYGYGYGHFQPYFSPVITGSWYARPYPYHFDYFRGHWNGREAALPPDCPCAEPVTQASEIEPALDASPAGSY